MLVLSRKEGEAIRIGDNVELVVLKSKGNSIRLGFRAPKDVAIHRKEVVLRDALSREVHPEPSIGQQWELASV